MQFPKDFLIKAKFVLIAIFAISLTKIFLKIMTLQSLIQKVQKISGLFLASSEINIPIERMHAWYSKVSRRLNIQSCLINSLSQKIIFSYFGFDLSVVCGVRFDQESNFKGHAWLRYNDHIVFEESKNIEKYIESFRV